jgi:dihydrofolate synthase/folylpolyglutamate synthase
VATINTSKSYLRYCTTKNGLEVVIKQIEKEFEVLHVVLGVVNDKDLNEILPLFPKKAHYYFLPNIPRGLEALNYSKASTFDLKEVYNSVSEAYNQSH